MQSQNETWAFDMSLDCILFLICGKAWELHCDKLIYVC